MIRRELVELFQLINAVEVLSQRPNLFIEVLSAHIARDIPSVSFSGHNTHLKCLPDIHVIVVSLIEELRNSLVDGLEDTIRVLQHVHTCRSDDIVPIVVDTGSSPVVMWATYQRILLFEWELDKVESILTKHQSLSISAITRLYRIHRCTDHWLLGYFLARSGFRESYESLIATHLRVTY